MVESSHGILPEENGPASPLSSCRKTVDFQYNLCPPSGILKNSHFFDVTALMFSATLLYKTKFRQNLMIFYI